MRDTLPRQPNSAEFGIVNLNTSSQPGSHWVCYYRNKSDFDSYGQITPVEIQRYLKTSIEFARGKEGIQRNTYIVQAANTPVCGHICVFVLLSLASGENFQTILNHMQHYGGWGGGGGWIHIKLLERFHTNRRGALFYRNIAITDPITPYTCK